MFRIIIFSTPILKEALMSKYCEENCEYLRMQYKKYVDKFFCKKYDKFNIAPVRLRVESDKIIKCYSCLVKKETEIK